MPSRSRNRASLTVTSSAAAFVGFTCMARTRTSCSMPSRNPCSLHLFPKGATPSNVTAHRRTASERCEWILPPPPDGQPRSKRRRQRRRERRDDHGAKRDGGNWSRRRDLGVLFSLRSPRSLRFCVWNFNAEDAEGAEVRRELQSQRGGKTSGENDDAEERWSQPPSSFCARCGVAIRTRLSRSIPLASACRWSLAIAARDRSAKSANRTNVSKNPQKQGPAKLGVKDFLTFVYDTEPEWALLAVKAPVEQVAGAFVRFRKAERWLRDVPRKSAAEGDDMGFPLIALLQLKDNPWAVVLRDVCDLTDEGMHGVAQDAKALSSKLKTRAITFVGEDTSGAVDYAIFDGGKMLEHAQWESGGPFFLI